MKARSGAALGGAGVLVVALAMAGAPSVAAPTDQQYIAVPPKSCDSVVTGSASADELYRWLRCGRDGASATPSASPSATASSTPSVTLAPSLSPTPTPTPSATASPSASPTTTTALPVGVTLVDIDGGLGYYGRKTNGLPTSPSFFPIGVWYESVRSKSDVDSDKAAGLNTYIELVSDSNGQLIRDAGGMYTFPTRGYTNMGSERRGWLTGDEVDMSGSGWYAAPNANQQAELEQSIAALPKDGTATWTNFGKGIAFGYPGEEAAERKMLQTQDIVSTDIYWHTDSEVKYATQGGTLFGVDRELTTTEVQRSSNYGAVVSKARRLLGATATQPADRPVWNFVELGGPFGYNTTAASYITPAEVRASVWHSLIAGARGVTYFNHSFGGPCQTQHLLRTDCGNYTAVRDTVTSTNRQITELAPVLNSPTAAGYVSAPASVKTLAKWSSQGRYVFAGSTNNAASTPTFTIAGGGSGPVEVVGENRTVQMTDGKFSDTFADGNAVHIYKI